jgi:hypothetical protein
VGDAEIDPGVAGYARRERCRGGRYFIADPNEDDWPAASTRPDRLDHEGICRCDCRVDVAIIIDRR